MHEKYEPIMKEGTHLAQSHKTDGTYRGILLDDETNQLAGQAEWKRVKRKCKYMDTDICMMILVAIISVAMTLTTVEIVQKINQQRSKAGLLHKLLKKVNKYIDKR